MVDSFKCPYCEEYIGVYYDTHMPNCYKKTVVELLKEIIRLLAHIGR